MTRHEEHTERISLRMDKDTKRAIAALRQKHADDDTIPSASDIMRRAVLRMYAEDVKPNGKHRNGKP